MAKKRMIDTRFWDDTYIANLDPIEKLLFLYFITNNATNISGVYELPLKVVALHTGIDKEMVEKITRRFEKDEKIFYKNGWVVIRNFIKHQNQNSSKVKKGIVEELKNVPTYLIVDFLGIDKLEYSEKPTLSKRQSVLIRDKFHCSYCDTKIKDTTYELDHIYPKSRGGKDLYTNIALSCRTCNQKKCEQTDVEFVNRKIVAKPYHAEQAFKDLYDNEEYKKNFFAIYPEYSLDVVTKTEEYPISTLSHLTKLNLTKPNITKLKKAEKLSYGEDFKLVKLTQEEYDKLINKLGKEQTESYISELDTYVASKGKKYSSHYATILSWSRRKGGEHSQTGLLDLNKK